MDRAICSPIHAGDIPRLRAPYLAVSVGATKYMFLVIHGAEYRVASQSQQEDRGCDNGTQLHGVPSQILRLERVGRRKENVGAPCEVVAVVLVADVDCMEVPGVASIDPKNDDQKEGRIVLHELGRKGLTSPR